MSEVITFPGVEALLHSHLEPLLGVPVVSRVPKVRPDRFVRVVRTGGTKRSLIMDAPMVVFEAWGVDEIDAEQLLALTRAHVHAMPGHYAAGEWVYRVREIAGPQAYPDPITESPRYVFTATIGVRGNAI